MQWFLMNPRHPFRPALRSWSILRRSIPWFGSCAHLHRLRHGLLKSLRLRKSGKKTWENLEVSLSPPTKTWEISTFGFLKAGKCMLLARNSSFWLWIAFHVQSIQQILNLQQNYTRQHYTLHSNSAMGNPPGSTMFIHSSCQKKGMLKYAKIKEVRCNPNAAPCLTSGGNEDKVDAIAPINILFIGVASFDPSWRYSWCSYPNQHIIPRGWRMLIPHEDKVNVIAPINILFMGGCEFLSLLKIKLILTQSTYCS